MANTAENFTRTIDRENMQRGPEYRAITAAKTATVEIALALCKKQFAGVCLLFPV